MKNIVDITFLIEKYCYKKELIMKEEIIFKWDREMIENLLKDIFEKIDR